MGTPTDTALLPDTAWLYALSRIPGVGNKTLLALLRHFGSGAALWQALLHEDITFPGIKSHILIALRHHIHSLELQALWQELITTGITPLGYTDDRYPPLLREIPDAPILLYARGTPDWNRLGPLITIVGTRKPSAYGRQVTQDFSRRLVQAGFTIVSGLAFGVDSLAHQATLESQGRTLAVIGSGVDDRSITPQSHLALAHRIIEQGGALLSEYIPGTQATVGTFPARNRIMAGMSPLTLVIEASEQSGTLITARLALEYHRDVCAVPGSIFSPGSVGCHHLIQQGAKLITSLEDILEELPAPTFTSQEPSSLPLALSQDEALVFELLAQEPLHIDQIILKTKKSASEITPLLTLLEMKGLAKNIGGMHYMRIPVN